MRVSAGLSGATLGETIAVAIHLEDVDVVGDAVEQRAGEALGSELFGPFVKWQVAGDQAGSAFVASAGVAWRTLGAVPSPGEVRPDPAH